MKNLTYWIDECSAKCHAAGIPIADGVEYHVSCEMTSTYGNCSFRRGHYVIRIAERLLADAYPLPELCNTIVHELLHTCPGCMNHGPAWLRWADVASGFGYGTIERLGPADDVVLDDGEDEDRADEESFFDDEPEEDEDGEEDPAVEPEVVGGPDSAFGNRPAESSGAFAAAFVSAGGAFAFAGASGGSACASSVAIWNGVSVSVAVSASGGSATVVSVSGNGIVPRGK